MPYWPLLQVCSISSSRKDVMLVTQIMRSIQFMIMHLCLRMHFSRSPKLNPISSMQTHKMGSSPRSLFNMLQTVNACQSFGSWMELGAHFLQPAFLNAWPIATIYENQKLYTVQPSTQNHGIRLQSLWPINNFNSKRMTENKTLVITETVRVQVFPNNHQAPTVSHQ